jgi:hypothetical protein
MDRNCDFVMVSMRVWVEFIAEEPKNLLDKQPFAIVWIVLNPVLAEQVIHMNTDRLYAIPEP